MSDNNKILVTARQASEMMGYTPGGLRMRRIRKQAPVYYKIGGKIMYDSNDIQEFIQGGKILPEDVGKRDE